MRGVAELHPRDQAYFPKKISKYSRESEERHHIWGGKLRGGLVYNSIRLGMGEGKVL